MKKNTVTVVVLFAVFLLFSCTATESASRDENPLVYEAYTYLQNNYISPEDYIIEKFKDYDVVILGEMHRIKHDPLLVQNLMPLLHKNGIYTVAIEFALYEDQDRIDTLVTAEEYDETLARSVHLNSFCIGLGGYHEYCDIFKAAWQVNKNLPSGVQKMRVLGVNDRLYWSEAKSREDTVKPEIRKKIFRDFSEKNWADRVKKEVLDKGEKVLCYCGMHHAFSKYRQPAVSGGRFIRFGDVRFGNYLYEEKKDKVFTISLHYPWFPVEGYDKDSVLPADGMIDTLLVSLPKNKRRFGFDTAGTPMGDFTGSTSLYKFGYDNFTLKDFCDGYICQGTFGDYEGVTAIKDFINETNIDRIKAEGYPTVRNFSLKQHDETLERESAAVKTYHLKKAIAETKKLKPVKSE
ncbi:hypothetical protein H0R92_08400 [Treponema sp. OMZ 840]|uniref:hypothetical protein n=1 Tax=Treponema sp. OMZ 840 TaxID=244313 RepID=UPI003D94F18C